jgi:hypothetical protein
MWNEFLCWLASSMPAMPSGTGTGLLTAVDHARRTLVNKPVISSWSCTEAELAIVKENGAADRCTNANIH